MMTADETIQTAEALERLCERVRGSDRVALDTEFHAERTYTPRLMVVQLAFDDGAVIVDPLAIRDLRPLSDALAHTLVVGHALSSDLKIFAQRFGTVPPRVFDTQVAASFLGYGMQISLADLVRDVVGVRLSKSQTVSDWSSRPFTPKQVDYLIDDVVHLLPIADALTARLKAAGRYEWAMEECAQLGENERYQGDERRAYLRIPGAMRMNRRELGILSEVVRLRDRVASERDLPPKYILADDVVSGIATLKPKGVDELAQLRRMDAGARKQLGGAIVDAVARGEALPEDQLPERPARPLGSSRDSLAAMLAVMTAEIARLHDLPQSLLVPRASLDRVARELPQSQADLEAALDLSAWRTQLVGEPLWRLLSGDSGVRIEGYAHGDPKIRLTP